MVQCVNCDLESDGNYCPACGQNLRTVKFSFKSIATEFTDKWLGLDTKFARTFIDLTIRPAIILSCYLKRNSVKYVSPLGYYVVVTTLMILSFDLLQIPIVDFLKSTNDSFNIPEGVSEKQREFQDLILNVFSSNFRFFSGLIIPFSALGLFILFKKRQSYLENLVLSLAIEGHTIWLTIGSIVLFALFDLRLNVLVMPISMVYFSWAISRFYRAEFKQAFFRALFAWLMGFLLFTSLISVITVIMAVFFLNNQI